MEKMGWRAGQGLGAQGQGITAPLVAKKVDARSGIIVVADDNVPRAPPSAGPRDAGRAPAPAAAPRRSRVVVLRNVVGPGQVDAALESEIADECGRFGEVLGVLLFEVTQPSSFPEEEAVRIYVKFAAEDAAKAALRSFDGRFFGGRPVRCSFFSETKFDAEDLAPLDAGR